MNENLRFTKVDSCFLGVVDPNPTEPASFELIILAEDQFEFDGDAILAELCMLYDQKLDFDLACKLLDDLADFNESTVYVGSHDKCLKWSGIFLSLGLRVQMHRI